MGERKKGAEDAQTRDFRWFVKHHDELYKQYPDKHIVIKDRKVLLSDDDFMAALTRALDSGLELGTFIVQHCTEGPEGYTVEYHSRYAFA